VYKKILLCMYCVLRSSHHASYIRKSTDVATSTHVTIKNRTATQTVETNARRHQVATTNDDEDDEDIENDSESEYTEPDTSRPPINYHTALLNRLVRLRY
jgi:hypothetical protein